VLTSCIYIPTKSFTDDAFPYEQLQKLTSIPSSKKQVIEELGQPIFIFEDENMMLHKKAREIAIIGTYGGGGSLADHSFLLTYFDDNEMLTDLELITISEDPSGIFSTQKKCFNSGVCIVNGHFEALLAPTEKDKESKLFKPEKDICSLYYAQDGLAKREVGVLINDIPAAIVHPDGFLHQKIEAGGLIELMIKPFNRDDYTHLKLTAKCASEQIIFVRDKPKIFCCDTSRLELITLEEGKKLINQRQRVNQSNFILHVER